MDTRITDSITQTLNCLTYKPRLNVKPPLLFELDDTNQGQASIQNERQILYFLKHKFYFNNMSSLIV